MASLTERYREIGILKSLGWKNSQLSNQIIFLSVIQSLIGSVIGILLGVLIIFSINTFHFNLMDLVFHIRFEIMLLLIALALLGALVAAIFSRSLKCTAQKREI